MRRTVIVGLFFFSFLNIFPSSFISSSMLLQDTSSENKIIVDDIVYKTLLLGYVTEFTYSPYISFVPGKNNQFRDSYKNLSGNSFSLTQYFIVNNYLAQVGIKYSELKGNYDINDHWEEVNIISYTAYDTINTHYYIVNGDSIPESVVDSFGLTSPDTTRFNNTYQGENIIRFYSIPINFGYRWRFENFAIYLKAGLAINIIESQKGYYYSFDEHNIVTLKEYSDLNMFYSASASVMLEYPFSRYFSLVLEPYYSKNFSFSSTQYFRKTNNLGLNFGLQFWF
jgi:hypothetical protein